MLDVRRLRLLRELSLRGTIVAVADALAFTPSAVSQQLGVLEREAGVALLERTGRGVTLTPAGWNLVHHAEAILERLERASAELADARHGVAGPIRIGTFPTAARVIVPSALADLARRHPDLEPMVSEIDPAAVSDALRAGELDVALVHEYDFVPMPAEPGLATRALCRESMHLASISLGPEVPGPEVPGPESSGPDALGDGPEASPMGRWRDAPWILATPGTLCHAMTIRACQAAGFTPRVRHHVDDYTAVLNLVAAGQGVAVVPRLGIADPPPSVMLTRLPMHRRTSIAFRSGAGGHPSVAAIVRALRAAVPEGMDGPL
jgi:DNA-binding transcriptional LysR family regulator